jgi:hypothetical protein
MRPRVSFRDLRPTTAILGLLLAACASPSAVEPSATPGASEARASPSETGTASPSAPASAPASAIGQLLIVAVDELNLREGPGTSAPIETFEPGAPISGQPIRASAGDLVWVLEEDRSGVEVWYHVVVDESYQTGWISSGPADEPWLTPFDPADCPSGLTGILGEFPVVTHSMRYPVCFGDESLSSAVYWPTLEESQQGECPWPDVEPRWLICYEWANISGDGQRQLAVYDILDNDQIRRGGWVTLAGHFSDPRSEHCAQDSGHDLSDPASVMADTLWCRAAFVLEDVGPP